MHVHQQIYHLCLKKKKQKKPNKIQSQTTTTKTNYLIITLKTKIVMHIPVNV